MIFNSSNAKQIDNLITYQTNKRNLSLDHLVFFIAPSSYTRAKEFFKFYTLEFNQSQELIFFCKDQ